MSGKIVIFIFTLCVLLTEISAYGAECDYNKDCQSNEICDNGSCRCSQGHVLYMNECHPIKFHGEECFYDAQCNDYRMVCTNEEHDVQQKRFCFCDTYHFWNSTVEECLEISIIAQLEGSFREAHNVSGKIERSAQKVFLGVVIAGLLFVCILLSFIGICSIYGCCTKNKGRYGENDAGNDQINEVAVIGLPQGTYEAIDTDFDMGVM